MDLSVDREQISQDLYEFCVANPTQSHCSVVIHGGTTQLSKAF